MRKMFNSILLCVLVVAAFRCGGLLTQREMLNENLIRLHVVADSDDAHDQTLKLQVRDAITEKLNATMEGMTNVEEAKAYLLANLSDLQLLAQSTLRAAGCEDPVTVTLEKEAFDTRHYDTFSLPAGAYEALRITIGSGEGRNWWCVVFPTLCYSAAGEEFEDTAAGAGFSDSLTDTLEGKDGYELRFFLLDVLGKLENLLYFG